MNSPSLKKIHDHYPVVIIGGGIVGAGIFRDLALNGVSCLIVDKKDFCSQTSHGSSKMLHGGIRYLEQYDFALVFEALAEKNLWLKLTPHLAYEAEFHLPIYRDSKFPKWMFSLGLKAYDFLSLYKNRPHKMVGVKDLVAGFPQLKTEGLRGGGAYFDGIVDDSKLGLECIYDGLLETQCHALNYVGAQNIQSTTENHEISLADELSGEKRTITAEQIIVATGPFTDHFMKKMEVPWIPRLLPSKGIHLWLDKKCLQLAGPLVLNLKDGRILFVIPQRDSILVGTTETEVVGDYFDLQANAQDIDYLLSNIREFFPTSNIEQKDILHSYAAVRPLIREGDDESRGKASRVHKVFWPKKNLSVIIGGKYTTFRKMAQSLVGPLLKKLSKDYDEDLTLQPLRVKSHVKTFQSEAPALLTDPEEIKKIVRSELVRTVDDLWWRRLSQLVPPTQKQRDYYQNILESVTTDE